MILTVVNWFDMAANAVLRFFDRSPFLFLLVLAWLLWAYVAPCFCSGKRLHQACCSLAGAFLITVFVRLSLAAESYDAFTLANLTCRSLLSGAIAYGTIAVLLPLAICCDSAVNRSRRKLYLASVQIRHAASWLWDFLTPEPKPEPPPKVPSRATLLRRAVREAHRDFALEEKTIMQSEHLDHDEKEYMLLAAKQRLTRRLNAILQYQ